MRVGILSCLPPNELACHGSVEADGGAGTPGSGTEDIFAVQQAP